ncbi:hypothetical protein NQ318_018074 [Aromia moschata]|uniref:CHK kinase-like domain-containing protein n=1 Tax=Aromia moschata TaxID=1265417 RepID=A0AAV8ZEJ7_9CUCU|nr:hypothetical protein NQ318_018074 [Aromia moschata]
MNSELTEDQNNLIKSIALKEGFDKYQLDVRSGSMKGDGFFRSYKKRNNKKRNVVLKSASTNKKLRNMIPIKRAYISEIYLYKKVLPTFNHFQVENNIVDGFTAYANIYGSIDKDNSECLVLEDLRKLNFKLWDRRVPMNQEHVALVMAEYGKLHGISLAMHEKRPELYKRLKEGFQESETLLPHEQKAFPWESIGKRFLDMSCNAVQGNPVAMEAMKRLSEAADTFFQEDMKRMENQIVIIHGDAWCNNMMFKYEGLTPTKVCLLDWQMSRIASPVIDLAYFFFASSSKEVLLNFSTYLKIYHENLTEILKKVLLIFSFATLVYHWKIYAKFGLFVAPILLRVMLSESDQVPDLEEIAEKREAIFDGASLESMHVKGLNQRIIDIVTVMSENKLV